MLNVLERILSWAVVAGVGMAITWLLAAGGVFQAAGRVFEQRPAGAPPSVLQEVYLTDGTRCVITADGRALACEWRLDR